MKKISLLLLALLYYAIGSAQVGYKVGDKASGFNLKNIDGKMVSLDDYKKAKGFVIVFTCNTCPYAVAYEDRLIELSKKTVAKDFPLIAVNPNDPEVQPADTYELMVEKSKAKGFNFPYLYDPGRIVSAIYGATRTPQIYILSRKGKDLVVEYIGAIDDNHEDAKAVKANYVENAVNALSSGKKPNPDFTKAVGCTVKKKSS
jgi:peroxiredoxin